MSDYALDLPSLNDITLDRWRQWVSDGYSNRVRAWHIWEPLREWFSSQGLELFVPLEPTESSIMSMRAPNGAPRVFDGSYTYSGDVRTTWQHLVSI
jgi:hypothetical protein